MWSSGAQRHNARVASFEAFFHRTHAIRETLRFQGHQKKHLRQQVEFSRTITALPRFVPVWNGFTWEPHILDPRQDTEANWCCRNANNFSSLTESNIFVSSVFSMFWEKGHLEMWKSVLITIRKRIRSKKCSHELCGFAAKEVKLQDYYLCELNSWRSMNSHSNLLILVWKGQQVCSCQRGHLHTNTRDTLQPISHWIHATRKTRWKGKEDQRQVVEFPRKKRHVLCLVWTGREGISTTTTTRRLVWKRIPA